MYTYDEFDREFLSARNRQFRDQVNRRLSGELTEDQFKPLRLMNGVYLQLHAYMLRVAVPYGTLSADQLDTLADIADEYDRGYGHFTTRQNIQFNWPALKDIPDILERLADVNMHAIQTSGNCIRNITSDPFAGVAADEFRDPRPYCELLRQWSSDHPEFSFLPRKFKIAISASATDRTALKTHDIALRLYHGEDGEPGFEVFVGGGQGRTPMVAKSLYPWVPEGELLTYIEAIMRAYNLLGRRDNKYKARIKILVHELGLEAFRCEVDKQLELIRATPVTGEALSASWFESRFSKPDYHPRKPVDETPAARETVINPDWRRHNLAVHKVDGYSIVTISLKPKGGIPGDATSAQMRAIAALARNYSQGELRVTKDQNLVLPHVPEAYLGQVYAALKAIDLASPNIGQASDIIACPGMDYCALATARSIPIAQNLSHRLAGSEREHVAGELSINISGCINACGHHHVANIGILGLDKKGQEFYQITLGGDAGYDTSVGKILGPGFSAEEVPEVVENLIDTYLSLKLEGEAFIETVDRTGTRPFKENLYGRLAA